MAGPDATQVAEDGPSEDWIARITAIALIAYSINWVAVTLLAAAGLYGDPANAVEVNLYRQYAQQVMAGAVPYRDFALEYPPLALVPIVAPALIWGVGEQGYIQAFQVVVAFIGMVTMILVMRTAAKIGLPKRDLVVTGVMVAASPILLGPLMLARYDLWPSLLLAAAAYLLVLDRPRLAGAALGLGVLAKVYPIVLAPFALWYLWRRFDLRQAVGFGAALAGVVALGLLPFAIAGLDGVIAAFARAFQRPIQVESTAAVLLYVQQLFTGRLYGVVHTFDSYNLTGPVPDLAGNLQSIVLGIVVVAAFGLYVRGRPTIDRMLLGAAAALVGYVALGRVLSPQYLIWLIAPVAVLGSGGRWPLALIGVAAAIFLTGLYYPGSYVSYFNLHEPLWIGVVLARNLVLVALTIHLVARLRPRGRGSAAIPT